MARFTDAISFYSGSSENGTWIVEGGTLGTQPTFNGDPLFSGSWVRMVNLVNFTIDVDMDNITSFGTGQYYVRLPFVSKFNYLLSDGCLHDDSTGNEYAILGHVNAGSDTMTLLTTTSNGQQNPFEDNTPIKLSIDDNFHIAGSYQAI